MFKKYGFLVLGILFTAHFAVAVQQPAALIFYEEPGATALIVDKSKCSVNVFKYQGTWSLVYKVPCSVGRANGEKFHQGDLKTPTGVYYLTNFWTGEFLIHSYGQSAAIYGAGAFQISYPNPLDDHIYHKSGSGIWLHGTDKKEPTATRGCVSTSNADLLKLAKLIDLEETPFIIENELRYISTEDSTVLKTQILTFLEEWRLAWETGQNQVYLNFYDKAFQTKNFDYSRWKSHKTSVNQSNQSRKIKFEHVAIFESKGFFHVRFIQNYQSSVTNDTGKKELFISKTGGELRIISEVWAPITPSHPSSSLRNTSKKK